MGPIYIGTSGWIYKSWEKTFYPAKRSGEDPLVFYARTFPTVEVNATFYRLPTLEMVHGWRDRTPDSFVFAVKGSRFLTHIRKLADTGPGLNRFLRRLKSLTGQTGVFLWQLPPFLKKDVARLENFLRRLPKEPAHAVEFRHVSWYADDEVLDALRRHGVAHVSVSSPGMEMNLAVTSDVVYVRFHGLTGPAHDYTRGELKPWVEHIRSQVRKGRTVFAYFNNDANARAPANAQLLMEMVGRDNIQE